MCREPVRGCADRCSPGEHNLRRLASDGDDQGFFDQQPNRDGFRSDRAPPIRAPSSSSMTPSVRPQPKALSRARRAETSRMRLRRPYTCQSWSSPRAVGGCSKTNPAGFVGWQTTWSLGFRELWLVCEPLCTGFFSTLPIQRSRTERPTAGRSPNPTTLSPSEHTGPPQTRGRS